MKHKLRILFSKKESFINAIKLFLLLSITSKNLFSQHPSCNGTRYKNFSFISIDSVTNVQYGQNMTMAGVNKNLKMDIFKPANDQAQKRPLIIFIHGGAFYLGSRHEFTPLSMAFAYYGFVTATIDYRLIDVPLVDSTTVTEGLVMAMGDAKAAIRYFVEDAATNNLYKVDTNYIFIAGGSAGGITASHTAYLNSTDIIPAYVSNLINAHGGFKGNSSSNLSHSTPIKGVLNYSGALLNKDWISPNEPALFCAHDLYDTTVPCNFGTSDAFSFPVYLNGSCKMQLTANSKGIYNRCFFNNSNGHGAYFNSSPLIDTVVKRSADFLYDVVCSNALSLNDLKNKTSFKLNIMPNPANNNITININDDSFGEMKIECWNLLGEFLFDFDYIENNQIDVSDLASGIYILRLKNHANSSVKFIKE